MCRHATLYFYFIQTEILFWFHPRLLSHSWKNPACRGLEFSFRELREAAREWMGKRGQGEVLRRWREAVAEMVTIELGLGLKTHAGEGVRGHPELQQNPGFGSWGVLETEWLISLLFLSCERLMNSFYLYGPQCWTLGCTEVFLILLALGKDGT